MESTSRDESMFAPIAPHTASLGSSTQSHSQQQQTLQHFPPLCIEQSSVATPSAATSDANPCDSRSQTAAAIPATATTTVDQKASEPDSPPESEPELKAPLSWPAQVTPTPSTLSITVLVQSGARHNFVLDRRFLERHSVKSKAGLLSDPLEMSVLQLKECIWKDWREDWDQRPASALFIKLIQFGAYLQDSNPLKECRLSVNSSNVIHMAIRPAEIGDDDLTQRSTKGVFAQSRDRESSSGSAGCRCVIL